MQKYNEIRTILKCLSKVKFSGEIYIKYTDLIDMLCTAYTYSDINFSADKFKKFVNS